MRTAKSGLPADLGYYHLWRSSRRPLSYLMQMRALKVGKMVEFEAPSIVQSAVWGLFMVLCAYQYIPNHFHTYMV